MRRPTGFEVFGGDESPTEKLEIEPAKLDALKQAKKELRASKKQRKLRERKEKKRFTAFNRARKRKIIAVSSVFIGLALFVVLGLVTPVMSVRVIEVHGSERIDQEEIKTALQPMLGTPIALVKEDEVLRLLTPFKTIERYSLQLIPPETLSVVIVERKAVLAVQQDDKVSLLDSAGVTLQSVAPEDKPAGVPITTGNSAKVGSAEFKAAARVISSLPEDLRLRVMKVSAESASNVVLILDDGKEVHWGGASENSFKALVLQSALASLGDRTVALIDVSSPNAPVFK